LATPDEARQAGAIAVQAARDRLLERGLDPGAHGRLLRLLALGIEQCVAARELGLDVAQRRAFVDAVYERLEADPVVDGSVEPPRRTLALRW